MKLKISELKPNPFKKDINGGKLNEEQIAKISSNIEELGLMGALPVFKKNEQYYLISGHHRLEALKRVKGKEFSVEVVVHNYTDDNVLRGMVVENLTQRRGEFVEEKENLLLIKKWLEKNAVHSVNGVEKRKDGRTLGDNQILEPGSVRGIAEWLNKQGEVMSIGKICSILQIAEKLSPELLERVGKAKTTSVENQDDEVIPVKTAELLAKIDSHEEQEALADILLDTEKFSSNIERQKAISVYNSLDEEEKEKVLNGKTDLSSVTKSEEALSGGEMALRFNKRANDLVLEMRLLRKTLSQFRSEKLFENFTPAQRTGFHSRLEKVREEYSSLMKELEKSLEVLSDE